MGVTRGSYQPRLRVFSRAECTGEIVAMGLENFPDGNLTSATGYCISIYWVNYGWSTYLCIYPFAKYNFPSLPLFHLFPSSTSSLPPYLPPFLYFSNVGQHAVLGVPSDDTGVCVCGRGLCSEHETVEERSECGNCSRLSSLRRVEGGLGRRHRL